MSTSILSGSTTTTTHTTETFGTSLVTKKSSEDTFNIRLSTLASLTELDHQTQKERVLYILDKTISKLQIAV